MLNPVIFGTFSAEGCHSTHASEIVMVVVIKTPASLQEETKLRLQKGQLFVLKCDVVEADIVTRLVHTIGKGTGGAIVNRDVDFDGIVLAHFIDEFWGNIIIHVKTDDIQPISANFARAPRRAWKDVG